MSFRVVLLYVLTATAALAAPALVRVDFAPGQTVAALAQVPVMMELDGWCLVAVDAAGLDRLGSAGFAATALDPDFDAGLYVYAMPKRGFDRSRLGACGRVLTSDERGVVLKTTEQGIGELNRLPVELARVPHEPMVISGSDQDLPAQPVVDDSLVWALVNRVNQDSVRGHISRLVDFFTRYSTTDSLRHAVEWIRTKFAGYGCDSTALEPFRSTYAPNVIGAKFGRLNRRPIYVICGHVDNTSEREPDECPGSDDNASGTAAVIEACRVFSGVEFDKSIYFIGFTGEEQGLIGSDSFCRRAARRGDSIKAALNFDMISYGRQNIDTFEVIGKNSNPNCAPLVDAFIANADTFSNLKTKRSMVSSAPYSDHDRFWARGWPAFCGIELDFTPVYHEIGDTIGPLYYTYCGTNNLPMATDAIRAGVATLAKLAGARLPTGVAEPGPATRPARILGVTPTVGSGPFRIDFAPGREPARQVLVFDAAGRTVQTLAGASWNGVRADGRRAAPGVYILKSTSHGETTTARLLLVD